MNWIEIIGTITGIIFIILEIKEINWMWPFGIISTACYIIFFYQSDFYALMILQFYYFIIGFYGWYYWVFGGNNPENPLKINNLKLNLGIKLSIITVVLFFAIWWFLAHFFNSSNAIMEAILAALGFVATWMITRKIIEQWYIWIFANSLSVFVFMKSGLYATSLLYVFYALSAFVGYYEWRKSLRLED